MGDTVVMDWLKIGVAAIAVIALAKYVVGPGGLIKVPGLTQLVGTV